MEQNNRFFHRGRNQQRLQNLLQQIHGQEEPYLNFPPGNNIPEINLYEPAEQEIPFGEGDQNLPPIEESPLSEDDSKYSFIHYKNNLKREIQPLIRKNSKLPSPVNSRRTALLDYLKANAVKGANGYTEGNFIFRYPKETETHEFALFPEQNEGEFPRNFVVTVPTKLENRDVVGIEGSDTSGFKFNKIPQDVTAFHELTHGARHLERDNRLNRSSYSQDNRFDDIGIGKNHKKEDYTGYDNDEERGTIGSLEDPKDFTENAYRKTQNLPTRLGHGGAMPDELDNDGHLKPTAVPRLFKNAIATGKKYEGLSDDMEKEAIKGFTDKLFISHFQEAIPNKLLKRLRDSQVNKKRALDIKEHLSSLESNYQPLFHDNLKPKKKQTVLDNFTRNAFDKNTTLKTQPLNLPLPSPPLAQDGIPQPPPGGIPSLPHLLNH